MGLPKITEPYGTPRRARIDLMTPAEKAIFDAIGAVEKVGAHLLLTDAVILLHEARDKVADYLELPEVATDLVAELRVPNERDWFGRSLRAADEIESLRRQNDVLHAELERRRQRDG